MKIEKKYYFIFGVVILFLVIGIFLFSKKKNKPNMEVNVQPTEEVLPTIDSSVKVDFKLQKKGEAVLLITNEPKNTKSIEFELSYPVTNTDLSEGGGETVDQGTIGKCYQIKNEWQCGEADNLGGRKIILGTCSSGVCRYHNIVGEIKVVLKFSGDYGERIFEKKYKL